MTAGLLGFSRYKRTIEVLSTISYRTGELADYLHTIANGVCELIGVDISVVTYCKDGWERILASSGSALEVNDYSYSLHGTLTNTVIRTGETLAVQDALTCRNYGQPPEGYKAYLGVPLRLSDQQIVGTICSFQCQPRLFEAEDIQIAELFAERAATALDNYRLYEQQRDFNDALEIEVDRCTLELREAQASLIEKERLAAVGQFAAMIVHEVRSPLATIDLTLNFFRRQATGSLETERLNLALSESARLERLLSEILLYSKPQQGQFEVTNLNEFCQQVLDTVQSLPVAAQRRIRFIPSPEDPYVQAESDRLKQVFINLVRNACEAVPAGAEVQWEIATDPGMNSVTVRIQNGGDPIPPEVLPRITELFYSTKAAGTGLGLAIVKQLVDLHGGTLTITSAAATGTIVEVSLPLVSNSH